MTTFQVYDQQCWYTPYFAVSVHYRVWDSIGFLLGYNMDTKVKAAFNTNTGKVVLMSFDCPTVLWKVKHGAYFIYKGSRYFRIYVHRPGSSVCEELGTGKHEIISHNELIVTDSKNINP